MSIAAARRPPIGELLRAWRERRRLSQLELALQADVSTRHLSFVETGRARPSPEMILRLTEHLDVPLRERNQLLLAGGYAPLYTESSLESPHRAAVRAAVRQVLGGHEPYPAAAVDRAWNIVEANRSAGLFMHGVARSPQLAESASITFEVRCAPNTHAPEWRSFGRWCWRRRPARRRCALRQQSPRCCAD